MGPTDRPRRTKTKYLPPANQISDSPAESSNAQAQALAEREKERARVQKNEEAYLKEKEYLRLARLEEARIKKNESSRKSYRKRRETDALTRLAEKETTTNEEMVSNDASPTPDTENNKLGEVKEPGEKSEVEVNEAKVDEEKGKEKEGEKEEEKGGEKEGDIPEEKRELTEEEALVQRNEARWLAKLKRNEQCRADKENATIARLRGEYNRLKIELDVGEESIEVEAGEEGESFTQQSPIQESPTPELSIPDFSTDSPAERLEDLPRHKRRVAKYTREYTPKELRLRTVHSEIRWLLSIQRAREERHKQRAIEIADGRRDSRGRSLWYPEKLKQLRLEVKAREMAESSQQSPDQESPAPDSPAQDSPAQESPIDKTPIFQMPEKGKPETKVAQYKRTLTPEQLILYEERRQIENERQRKQRQEQKDIEIANGQRDARGKLLWWPEKVKKRAAMEAEAREREEAESSNQGPPNEEPPAPESPIDDTSLFQMPKEKPESKLAQYKSTLTPEQLARFNEKRETSNERQRKKRQEQKEIEIANGQRDARGKLLWWPEKLKRAAIEAEAREKGESSTQMSSNQDSPDQESPTPNSQDQESPVQDSLVQESPVDETPIQMMSKAKPESKAAKLQQSWTPEQMARYKESREIFNGKRRAERQQQKEIEIANGQRDANGKLLWWSEKRKRDALELEEARKREASTAGSLAEGASTEQAKRSASEELEAAEELKDKRLYKKHIQQRNRQIQKDTEIAQGQRSADGKLLWYPEKLVREAMKEEEDRKREDSFAQGSSTQKPSAQESATQPSPNKESPAQQPVTRKRKESVSKEESTAEFEERRLHMNLKKQADRQNQEERETARGQRSANRTLARSQASITSSNTLTPNIGVQNKPQAGKMDGEGYEMIESSEVRKDADVSAAITDEHLQASVSSSISQSGPDNSSDAWWRALQ
ncbi:uncharacterized protein LAJ45_09720 [Morchella importuna]|uniref:Uncharacterized protein n=1 Tax=Morchella conica CCBAS932 TaxID=1392247 RepID=A0A3N4KJ03_9PEZI|nr:uncharacterized protein LAJ45_09720 [Morchella importuna]KAH8146278.1 hypothetical protein LAJ45_09720 [Morchella importuna]RPB09292.1 hypothetical protein P167DRAFT_608090 [Morchella conica CCBAS932]